VLFGATSPAQIADNVGALDLDPATVERVLVL
jgi:aryl-alcohol dehydrogenase-like predicted oxidoreductase